MKRFERKWQKLIFGMHSLHKDYHGGPECQESHKKNKQDQKTFGCQNPWYEKGIVLVLFRIIGIITIIYCVYVFYSKVKFQTEQGVYLETKRPELSKIIQEMIVYFPSDPSSCGDINKKPNEKYMEKLCSQIYISQKDFNLKKMSGKDMYLFIKEYGGYYLLDSEKRLEKIAGKYYEKREKYTGEKK